MLNELKFNAQGKELLLAYSGGADSKALLFILLALLPRLGCTLSLVHLDHGLRESSARELEEARALAATLVLPCHARRVDVNALARERGLGSEEAGRLARQEFFAQLLAENEQRWVVTGHQLNDLAEDILMRLLRGAGWPALGGMTGLDAKRRLLRPILLTPRQDLEAFLTRLEQNWIRDPLNEDPAYLRNRVRAELLPIFLRENPAFLDNAANLWRLAGWDNELFAELEEQSEPAGLTEQIKQTEQAEQAERAGAAQAPQASQAPQAPKTINVIELEASRLNAPKALRLRLYKSALEKCGPGQPLLNNLLALDSAWLAGRSGAVLQFPGGKSARVLKDKIRFSG